MATSKISGQVWAVARAEDGSRKLHLRAVPDPLPFPDTLYPEVWAALGYMTLVTVDETGTVQGLERVSLTSS